MQPTFEQCSKVVQSLHTTKYKCKKGTPASADAPELVFKYFDEKKFLFYSPLY